MRTIFVLTWLVFLLCLAMLPGCQSQSASPPVGEAMPTRLAMSLGETLDRDLVRATAKGNGLEHLDVELTLNTDLELEVVIEAGTLFHSTAGNVQNMVVTRQEEIMLTIRNVTIKQKLEAACTNMHLDQPGAGNLLTYDKTGPGEAVHRLVNLSSFADEDARVKQFAIWTLTDNPPREGFVEIGQYGVGAGPSDAELERVRALFVLAEIDPKSFQVFGGAPGGNSATPMAEPGEAIVSGYNTKLYAGPGETSSVLGELNVGTTLRVLGKNGAGNWIRVIAPNGKQGWVFRGVVHLNVGAEALPVILDTAPITRPTAVPKAQPTALPTAAPRLQLCPANPALVELENALGTALTLRLQGPGNYSITLANGVTRHVCVEPGTYSFTASAAGYNPMYGSKTFSQNGAQCWTFYQTAKPNANCSPPTSRSSYSPP